MQSPLIFMAEFQTAKSRLLRNFELSDHGSFSQERNDDAQGREERLSILKPWKSYSMYERGKLLRTECYRTRSAGTKTESVNPNTPTIRRRSFVRRLRLLRIILRPPLNPKIATELEHVIQTGAEK
jgi:hypothetical protein